MRPANIRAMQTGTVAALEQVGAERGVPFGGEALTDAPDVVVKAVGLMDHHYARKRPSAIWENQV